MVRLVLIQHALIDLINFIDQEARWVPKDRRSKLDVLKLLKGMSRVKLITKKQCRELEDGAKKAGLIG